MSRKEGPGSVSSKSNYLYNFETFRRSTIPHPDCSLGSKSSASGTEVTKQVTGLDSATTYYWKVVANDGKGGVTESDVFSFTTN